MKYIDVKLSLPVVAPLLDVLKQAASRLEDNLAAPLQIEDLDPDFREVWTDELLSAQQNEMKIMLGLFGAEFYASGLIRIAQNRADDVVRSCSALRLEIRRSVLEKITDEMLEAGSVDPEVLKEPQKSAFLCYAFLATLQELVIQHLDGGLNDPAES